MKFGRVRRGNLDLKKQIIQKFTKLIIFKRIQRLFNAKYIYKVGKSIEQRDASKLLQAFCT